MAQDVVNDKQNISYTNLDFSSIYTEVLDMVIQLTKDWNPAISDESDPGVVLVKLSALLADKCNYNIDKSILEAFPLSVTQESNARQLYEQLGYYMHWYRAATTEVQLTWKGSSYLDSSGNTFAFTIPKFTTVTNDNETVVYTLVGTAGDSDTVVSDGVLYSTASKQLNMIAYEGVPTTYTFNGQSVITPNMVDNNNRLYFATPYVFENGIFITNKDQNNYAEWKRVDNLYEYSYNELRYKFGYDSSSNLCYIEFPDNYAQLFGSGIEIVYLTFSTTESYADVPAQYLSKFLKELSVVNDTDGIITLGADTITIYNIIPATGHKEKEAINDAYKNYKKTVGTFKTLITLRDYLNYIRSEDLNICSNAIVTDRTNDIQNTYKILSKQNGVESLDTEVLQANDSYSYKLTRDETIKSGKQYYIHSQDGDLIKVTNPAQIDLPLYYEITKDESGNYVKTKDEDINSNKTYFTKDSKGIFTKVSSPDVTKMDTYYEFDSLDTLSPFSLKFYLLSKGIALTNRAGYDDTFAPVSEKVDVDSVLEDSSHLVHTFGDIESVGTQDDLLTKIMFLKYKYPVNMNISTYTTPSFEVKQDISKNILLALYANLDSSSVDFGTNVSLDYLRNIILNADTRIKDVSFDTQTSSKLYAVYYDDIDNLYKEILIPSNINATALSNNLSNRIGRDIICKSILNGTTQLLVPADKFKYHLNQKYITTQDDIAYVTGEAVIDLNSANNYYTLSSTDSSTIYKVSKSYTLGENETLTLFRPSMSDETAFSTNVHYDYICYSDLVAGQAYQLTKGEKFIFYVTNADSNGQLQSYTIYVYGDGTIISSTEDIPARNSLVSTSVRLLQSSTAETQTSGYSYTETSSSVLSEITTNTVLANTKISTGETITIKTVDKFTINKDDSYRFLWVTNNLISGKDADSTKQYQLFDQYDSLSDVENNDDINTYTLKSGEVLYYTNSTFSDLGVLGAGTTIRRKCGVNGTQQYLSSGNGYILVNYNDLIKSNVGNGISKYDNPSQAGLLEYDITNGYSRTTDQIFINNKDYFILLMTNTTGWFTKSEDKYYPTSLSTSDVFKETSFFETAQEVTDDNGNKTTIYHDYAPAQQLFERPIIGDVEITDSYRIGSKDATTQNYIDGKYSNVVTTHKRYTKSLDGSFLTTQFIKLADNTLGDYIDTLNPETFGDVTISNPEEYYSQDNIYVLPYKKSGYNNYYYIPNEYNLFIPKTYRIEQYLNGRLNTNNDEKRYFYKNADSDSTFTYEKDSSIAKELPQQQIYNLTHALSRMFSESSTTLTDTNILSKLNSYVKNSLGINIDDNFSNFAVHSFENPAGGKGSFIQIKLSGALTNYNDFITALKNNQLTNLNDNLYLGTLGKDLSLFMAASCYTGSELFKSDSARYMPGINFFHISSLTNGINVQTFKMLSDLLSLMDNKRVDTGTFFYNLHLKYQPRWYYLDEWRKVSTKTYYAPVTYYATSFGSIPAWVCTAFNNDKLAKNTRDILKNSFAELQDNTELEITKNQLWTLSEGDTITATVSSNLASSTRLPIFTNEESQLDLDAYDLSYQRRGNSFVDLDKISVENCSWRGYSNLLINSSGTHEQKLNQNHSLIAYDSDKKELCKIQNDENNLNVHFQLQNAVENKTGKYVPATVTDQQGNILLNSLYAYNTALSTDKYTFTVDNDTYVHFNLNNSKESIITIENVCLPVGKYLIPIRGISGYKINIDYNTKWKVADSTTNQLSKITHYPDTNNTYFVGNKTYLGAFEVKQVENGTQMSSTIEIHLSTLDGKNVTDSQNVILNDIFKYDINHNFDDTTFKMISTHIRNMDKENKFNYTHVPNDDEVIENPLSPYSFWDKNHVYNQFTIAQLDADNITVRFIS